MGSTLNHDIEWKITKKAITLVKNEDALPMDASNEKTVVLNHDSDYTLSTEYALGKLKESGDISDTESIGNYTFSDKEIDEIEELIKDAKNVIIDNGIGSTAKLNPENNTDITKIENIIDYAHQQGAKIVVISYSLPYDVGLYQDADAIMIAYSAKGMSSLPGELEDKIIQYGANVPAAIYLCMSKSESPSGVLPVNIPALTSEYTFSDEYLYTRGYGLTYPQNQLTLTNKNTKISGIKKKYTYTKAAIKPKVKVVYNNEVLTKGADYSVSFSKNKNIGKATVTIKGIGQYTGTLKKSFKIVPKSVKNLSVKGKMKKIKVSWKTQNTDKISGFNICYSTSKKFAASSTKKITITKARATSKTLTNLKSNKKYYVKIRTYKSVSGIKYYSKWSKVASAKTTD